jgi:tetratricopeptide (TPR) repeat protein
MRFWRASDNPLAMLSLPTHRVHRTLLLPFVAVAVLLLGLAAPSSAGAATARSALHDGYSRLVFDFGTTPKFTASVEGNQLVVRFEAPFDGNLSAAVMRGVDGYLSNPKISADQRSVSFTLLKAVTLKASTTERAAVIDMVEQKGQPAPTASTLPQTSPQATPGAQTVPAAAPTTLTRPPEKPVAQAPTAQAPTPLVAASAALPADVPRVKVNVGDNGTFTRFVFDWPAGTSYRVSSADGVARITFDKAGQFDLVDIRRRLTKSIASVEAATNGSATEFALALPPNAKLLDRKIGTRILLDVQAPPNGPAGAAKVGVSLPAAATPVQVAQSPAQNQPKSEPAFVAQPVPVPVPITAPPKPPAEPLIAPPPMTPVQPVALTAVQGVDKTVTIRVPTAAPAAAYLRDDQLYLAFAAPLAADLSAVSRLRTRVEPEQLKATHGSILRLTVPTGLVPTLGREEAALVIVLRPRGPARPDSALPVTSDAEGGLVTIATNQASFPISAVDPDTGALWRFIALPQTTRGIDAPRDFAQVALPRTLSGVLIVPKTDTIEIRVTPSAVTIGASLSLSQIPGRPGSVKAYDFAKWKIPDDAFLETRQRLLMAVTESDEMRRPSARFDLAQFFVAQAQYPDAIGVLELIGRMTPALASDPALLALRGAVRVMREEGAAALPDLMDRRLDSDPEALLWRAAASAQIESWAAADDLFRRAGGIPEAYPMPMRAKLTLLAGEAAEKVGDSRRALAYTDVLARPDAPPEARAEAEFIRAKVMLKTDRRSLALPILDRLRASDDRRIRAHVEPVWVEEALRDGRIDRLEAIERLEKTRYAWSGGSLEYVQLKRLADLYMQGNQIGEALRTLREALVHFPAWSEADKIKERMTDAFINLYDTDSVGKVPPLAALALYDDYRDLTPAGPRGDALIQSLADRLVQIDLLDRAADLLTYQIDQRLSGVEKAKVGTRLAVVQLLDRRPKEAVTAIDRSDVPNLPTELQQERRRLKARALMEAGEPDRGLSVIEGDISRDGELLRAQLLSRAQNWAESAAALTRLAGSPSDRTMTPEREGLIINLAIATALSGEPGMVSRLRADFEPLMAQTGSVSAFELLTGSTRPSGSIDQTALAQRFTELDIFQRAMADYRQKVQKGQLSAIN